MQRLQIELVLALLRDCIQVRTQRRFSDGFRVIVVVLLALIEWLYVDRWNNPRLKTHLAQRATDKVGTQTRLHSDNTTRQLFERRDQCKAFDLLTQNALPIVIKTNNVKCVVTAPLAPPA